MVFLVQTSRRSEGVTFSPVRVQHGVFGSDWSCFRRCLVLTVLSSELCFWYRLIFVQKLVTFSPVRVQNGVFGSAKSWFRACLVLTVLSSELCFWYRLIFVQKLVTFSPVRVQNGVFW